MLAADMVWDAEGQGNARSVFTGASSQNASWRSAPWLHKAWHMPSSSQCHCAVK